eukprot:1158600-Pelagomonas_calceolata.AAC.6
MPSPGCNETVALGHKEQAMTGGRISLWHLPIPGLRNGGTSTPFLRLPAHSVHAHIGNLLKCWLPSSRKASSLTFSTGSLHLTKHPACFYLCQHASCHQLDSALHMLSGC